MTKQKENNHGSLVRFISRRISSTLLSGKGGNRTINTGARVATISIALSIAIISVASVVTSGFQQAIDQKLRIVASDGTVTGYKHLSGDGSLEYNPQFVEALESLEFVDRVYPQSTVSGTLEDRSGGMCGVVLLGVDSLFPSNQFSRYITHGEFDLSKSGDLNKIILSESMAQKVGVSVGETTNVLLLSSVPITIPMEVSALFNTSMAENDDHVGYISLALANSLSSLDSSMVAGFKVIASAGVSQDELLERFENETDDLPVVLTTTKEQFPYIYDWLSMLDNNVQLLVVIMLVVAGFNMICAVLILILEQTRTIGIFKSLGMQDRTMRQIFLLGSLKIAVRGALWGAVIATALMSIQNFTGIIKLDPQSYMLDELPVAVEWGKVLMLNGILLGAIILFTLLPTFIISRISPAKTLKFS